MKQKLILFISLLLAFASCGNPKVEQDALPQKTASFRTDVPLDSIILSDPCILADAKTRQYYMTGTGGLLWKSKDLALWEGPYRVADIDTTSWMGSRPQIWAAELHEYNGKYYYFATFTNNSIAIDTVGNNVIPRRASHVLVSDKAEGPYRPMADPAVVATVKRWSSLGSEPFEEHVDECTWELALVIPATAFFRHHLDTLDGKVMKGNFYKCGDKLQTPHFLSWSPIRLEKPQFHCPQFFGTLNFE